MSLPAHLTGLSPREAVLDGLYRCVNALDQNDKALFESGAMTGPETCFKINGNVKQGFDAVMEMFNHIGPMDTTHIVTNPRVEIAESTDKAKISATTWAQHYRPGEGSKDAKWGGYLAGGFYTIDMEKDPKDGLWKFRTWELTTRWTEGDPAVMRAS